MLFEDDRDQRRATKIFVRRIFEYVAGTEPYIVGVHTAAGYCVDAARRTTLKNLYAAGDAAGACPQKYVTGAFAEAEIAAENILASLDKIKMPARIEFDPTEFERFFENESAFSTDELEIAMQTAMDEYAGGWTQNYRFNGRQLELATSNIERIEKLSERLRAVDMYDLLKIFELRERLTVAKVLIEHLKARRETRWAGFAQNLDFPERDTSLDRVAINSRLIDGEIKIILRDLGADCVEENL